MNGSEFAARNPRAVVDSLERAARCTWRELQLQRRGPWTLSYNSERARHEAEMLRVLLNIRRGIE